MKSYRKISRKELAAILQDEKTINGSTFVGFDALTVMDLNKTLNGDRKQLNPHYGKVRKVLGGQVGILFSDKTCNGYENMVNRRLALEGKEQNFVVSQRSWGERKEKTSFIQHTPKNTGLLTDYLFVIYNESPVTLLDTVKAMGIELNANDAELIEAMKQRTVAYESKSGTVEYLLTNEDGTTTPIAKGDIQGQPPAKSEGSQGGLSEGMKVIPRTFKLESIQRLTLGGVNYLIED